MVLIKTRTGDNEFRWVLTVNVIPSCRYCKGLINFGDYGYYCPNDKNISCMNCKDKDKDNDCISHSKRYFTRNNNQHIHYLVELVKSKIEEV